MNNINSTTKSITFFMLVTDKDCIFGDYGIKSFNKIYRALNRTTKEKFTLYIYLNNLSDENKIRYIKTWDKLPYTILFDNKEKVQSENFIAGELITSPEGVKRIRDEAIENYDELWSTELKKFNTDYVATVDADFEVLNSDFYFYLINQLAKPDYLVASTSYGSTNFQFDTYSNRNILLNERNHTWFCIYKKEAFTISKRSHFYFEKLNDKNVVHVYDSAAYFQEELRIKSKKKFIHLPDIYRSTYIHYGAGSKNKSINHKNVRFYRWVFLLTNVGIIHKSTNNALITFINKATRKISSIFFKKIILSLYIERSTFSFLEKNKSHGENL